MAAKKDTLESKIDSLTNIVEKGFMAVAGDIGEVKGHLISLHTQVNSIEKELRGLNRNMVNLEDRLDIVEQKIFH